MKIGFIKIHEDAKLPKRNNDQPLVGDSGYDVYAVQNKLIPARGIDVVDIGLEIAYIEPKYWIRVESRSGIFFRNNITVFNGIVDNSFRGGLRVALINNGDDEYWVKKGDRIAQLVVYPLLEPEIVWMDKKEETVRGDNGFGSSGR